MNWEAVGACVAFISGVATLASAWSTLSMKAAMEKMRADISEQRSKDMNDIRKWIDGSFLRSGEAIAEMKAFEIRMNHTERDVRDLRLARSGD